MKLTPKNEIKIRKGWGKVSPIQKPHTNQSAQKRQERKAAKQHLKRQARG